MENFSSGDLAEFRLFFGQRPGPGVNHVIIHSEDERSIHHALRPVRGERKMASLKFGGRYEAPADHSPDWFECSEDDSGSCNAEEFTSSEESVDGVTGPLVPTLPLYRISVKHTFIDAFESADSLEGPFNMPPAGVAQTP